MMKRDTTIVNTLLSEYHNIKNFQVPTLVFTDFQRLPRPQKGALKTGKTFKHSQGPGKASMYREEENKGPGKASMDREEENKGPGKASMDREEENKGPGKASMYREEENRQ